MTFYILAYLFAASLASCFVMLRAIKKPVEGYEDKDGFHLGVEPFSEEPVKYAEIHEIHSTTDQAA
jgi:hypothetical protein